MTSRVMYQVDAFADHVFGGNPAAVLILDDWLPDELMQSIAEENNLAETAFARPIGAGWELRWFTPVHEVDFCGHATLATAHVLATEHGVTGDMVFATRVGDLRVARSPEGYDLDLPGFPPEPLEPSPPLLAEIFAGQPIAAFRNFKNLFVALPDEQAVRGFVPDLLRIAALPLEGLVITAAGEAVDFVSRYFAPAGGIPEDPVTGSIHATLVPYWADRLGKTKLTAFQCSRRGGRLMCKLAGARVVLTGRAATFMKAEIFVAD